MKQDGKPFFLFQDTLSLQNPELSVSSDSLTDNKSSKVSLLPALWYFWLFAVETQTFSELFSSGKIRSVWWDTEATSETRTCPEAFTGDTQSSITCQRFVILSTEYQLSYRHVKWRLCSACKKLTDNRLFQDLLDNEFTASNDSLSENTTTKVSFISQMTF